MKKLILTVIAFMFCTGLYADLSKNELASVKKLSDFGVYTELRTVTAWEQPISVIDSASADIKLISLFKNRYDFIDWRIKTMNKSLIEQNKRFVAEKNKIEQKRKEYDQVNKNQTIINVLLGFAAVIGILT